LRDQINKADRASVFVIGILVIRHSFGDSGFGIRSASLGLECDVFRMLNQRPFAVFQTKNKISEGNLPDQTLNFRTI